MEAFKKSPWVNVAKCIRDILHDKNVDLYWPYLGVCSFAAKNNPNIGSINFAFIWASRNGNESIVKYLIENGADVHAYNDSAVRWAAQNGHASIVRYLIDHGANIHALGDYALQYAALGGHELIVRYLVENGADIHAQNDLALRWAIEKNHRSIVRYLIENGTMKER